MASAIDAAAAALADYTKLTKRPVLAPPPKKRKKQTVTPRSGQMFETDSAVSESEQHQGVIKWYNDQKGYGFIVPAGGGKDIFFHVKGLFGGYEPQPDDDVTYRLRDGKGGPEAYRVKLETMSAV